jgi:hypothetical protein
LVVDPDPDDAGIAGWSANTVEMEAVEAQRTLVKSVPELWAQLSERQQLAPLLDETFGEIRITRLEPETLIAWESDLARGEVELATSGFGTRVRLTAELGEPEPEPPPPVEEPRRGFVSRLLARGRRSQPPAPAPPAAAPAPLIEPGDAQRALGALLDEVGTPRHRPFSR